MSFVQAKCPECGGMLAVDDSKKAAICQFCGEAFIVQEAVNNYNTYNTTNNNYSTTHNYGEGAVVNVYEDKSKDFVIEAGTLKEYHGEQVDVVIPNGVKAIGAECFAGSAIESVTFSDSVERICSQAFKNCNRIKKVHIPSNISVIEYEAFSGCSELSELTFDEGIKEIQGEKYPSGAFSNCSSLEFVELPSSLLYVGGFSNCKNLRKVKINYGPNCIKRNSFSGSCIQSGGLEEIDIPNSVTTIENAAFEYCKNLKSVILPDSITTIERDVFGECEELQEIKLPNSLTEIGSKSFWKCKKLRSIKFPDSLMEIGESAFFDCENLKSITFPKNSVKVGYLAFSGCDNLKAVVPSNVLCWGGFNKVFPYSSDKKVVSQEEYEKIKRIESWKNAGLCQYCGGKFRYSIFGGGKECRNCGHYKDY